MKIPFNRPPYTGNEDQYVINAMRSPKISGDGYYAHKCERWFEQKLGFLKVLLTPSCTQALEMAALLIDVQPGDEIIMPSYTFVSTANAFVLRGAKIVFIDINPDTMNIDETLIEQAITSKTKAIVPVHYAGVGCNMDTINEIAEKYGLFVIEDAAQGMLSTYKSRQLGSLGHMAAFSFHETKNYTSGGEGGLLIINDEQFIKRAEIIREKGTNRAQFFRGMLDKYTWVDTGSSYLPSELQSAYLWGQLEKSNIILKNRLTTWDFYSKNLSELSNSGFISTPKIPKNCRHNGHMFYIKCENLTTRTNLLSHLKNDGIQAVFHYVPLHSAPAGLKFGYFHGEDKYTTSESDKLIRLPFWYEIEQDVLKKIVNSIHVFFDKPSQ